MIVWWSGVIRVITDEEARDWEVTLLELQEAGDVVGWEDSPLSRPLVVEREDDLTRPPARLQGSVGPDDVPGTQRQLVLMDCRVPAGTALVSVVHSHWSRAYITVL